MLVQAVAVTQAVIFSRRFVVAALRQTPCRLRVVVCIDKRLLVEIIICFYAAKPVSVGQGFLAGRDVERISPKVGTAGQFAG